MKKLRFGIVGFGHIGKKHCQHIQNNPEATLVAVCDIDAAAYETIKDSEIQLFSQIDVMLDSVQLDVLCICTPNYLHSAHALNGIEHHCHVVVEKPMALRTEDCDLVLAAAEKNNVRVFTVMQNRYAPSAQFAKKLLEEGELGKIFQIEVNCFWNRNQQYYAQSAWRGTKKMDGGILYTQFSHFVDILYYLEGDMAQCVGGQVANYNHPYIEIEDTGAFVMKSKKGALVSFNYSICSYNQNMESALVLIGEKGTIKIGGQYLNKIEYLQLENKNIQIPQMNPLIPNDYGFYQGSMNNHDKVIHNVVSVLLHGNKEMSDGEDGRAVVSIIEKMYQKANECAH